MLRVTKEEHMKFWIVKDDIIFLYQIMKAAGLEEDYAVIRQVIRGGKVSVNDQVTLKQRHELKIGDTVQYESKHVIILESDPLKEDKEKPVEPRKLDQFDRPIKHGGTKNWSARPLNEEKKIEDKISKLIVQIQKTFVSKQITLSLAESCTGGMAQEFITSLPGSSGYYKGGVISYSDDVKKNLLSVNSKTLDEYGAVSEQVASELALGIKNLMKVDVSGSITGIAGPDGGTDAKPVGCVFISISSPEKSITKKFLFSGNRNLIRMKSVLELFKLILENI